MHKNWKFRYEKKFKNSDDFENHVEEQDRWIYSIEWSLPEHKIYSYRLEKFDKYAAEKQVEHIIMDSGEDIPNRVNVSYAFYDQGKQSRLIWSGHVNSPDEYQEMMVVVNKFIEEYKKNSGAI